VNSRIAGLCAYDWAKLEEAGIRVTIGRTKSWKGGVQGENLRRGIAIGRRPQDSEISLLNS
ncbi:MAG TPA: hypothetical protein VK638_20185, partial [Edaphobacter sp.]|nr:hypothetical protein [Edaphobacter sp.]